jgi:hypothetical protein
LVFTCDTSGLKKNYITGISFALRGWRGFNFSHQTHAVGLVFVDKKFLELWQGRPALRLLGSASNQKPERSQVLKCFTSVKHPKIKLKIKS